MAMLDDRAFLVTHIRNSFITSDDTGMCELILENEDFVNGAAAGEHERHFSYSDRRPTSWPYKNSREAEYAAKVVCSFASIDSDPELAHSCDIVPDMDFGGHRRRSDTAQRLDKLKRDKHKQSQIQHIQWKNVKSVNSSEAFEAKPVAVNVHNEAKKSALSLQLEQFEMTPHNPFIDYAKYDGRASGGMPTKNIDIYLTMAPACDRPYPMTITTLCTAKVQDLIGLICWQYSTEKREPTLNENIDAYSLYMVEDDGEVDMDFPPLENREPIAKFGFNKLALVGKKLDAPAAKPSYVVTVNIPRQGDCKFVFDNGDVPLKDLLEKVLASRNPPSRQGFVYRLEKRFSPGVPVDLEQTLSSVNTTNFSLVRENSVRDEIEEALGREEAGVNQAATSMDKSLGSHTFIYQSYIVNMLHRLRANSEVRIGISGEKIEIYPTGASLKSLRGSLMKQKAVTYSMDDIAECMLHDEKSSGRAVFRLVQRSSQNEFKHRDFECDARTAKEIVSKIASILDMRLSPVRQGYVTQQLQQNKNKTSRRHTVLV